VLGGLSFERVGLGLRVVRGKEEHRDGERRVRLDRRIRRGELPEEEVAWKLREHADAVAAAAVRCNRSAVPEPGKRGERAIENLAARLAVERGNEADAAGVAIVTGIQERTRHAPLYDTCRALV